MGISCGQVPVCPVSVSGASILRMCTESKQESLTIEVLLLCKMQKMPCVDRTHIQLSSAFDDTKIPLQSVVGRVKTFTTKAVPPVPVAQIYAHRDSRRALLTLWT